jgi:UrcA family protein
MRIALLGIAALLAAAPAVAADAGYEQWAVTVRTADLDLATTAGQRQLDARLAMALTRLCGQPVMQTPEERDDLAACRADAMAAAAPQIAAARARLAVAVADRR